MDRCGECEHIFSLFWARTQRDKGIKDSAELYMSDTLKGGENKPELAKVLCEKSGADVEWLLDKYHQSTGD